MWLEQNRLQVSCRRQVSALKSTKFEQGGRTRLYTFKRFVVLPPSVQRSVVKVTVSEKRVILFTAADLGLFAV
jgi:hypothetical protein